MTPKSTLSVTQDFTKRLQDILKGLKRDAVLVGVPEEKGARRNGDSISNATLLAINNFGSPARNIPARPVLQVGLRNAQDQIAEQFKRAAQMVLTKGPVALNDCYERAGTIAANSVKKAINDQDFDGAPGPAESTLAARKSHGFLGEKSLVVSGQLRNSITYVFNKENK